MKERKNEQHNNEQTKERTNKRKKQINLKNERT